MREVPAERVRDLDLDLIIFQTEKNLRVDQLELLSDAQRALPRIYLEHNAPRPHPTDSVHPLDDPDTLLVHVTNYNRLMWDNGRSPTMVIEHSVAIDPGATYTGELARGITVINGLERRGRIAGFDLFQQARELVPLDAVGMETEAIGGFGDVPYRDLHRLVGRYRFLFSPIRYTSLPLAVIEGLALGMPVIALATTELPAVIENGRHGFVSCNVQELIGHMRRLLEDPDEARYLGRNARRLAEERFGLARFARRWNEAFARAGVHHTAGEPGRQALAGSANGRPDDARKSVGEAL